MMSSTTPPLAVQHNVYWAWPAPIFSRSAVKHRLTKRGRARPGHRELAEVADVEDPDGVPHRVVLGHGAVGIGERHRPATEGAESGPEREVPVVQRAREEAVRGVHRPHATGPTARVVAVPA